MHPRRYKRNSYVRGSEKGAGLEPLGINERLHFFRHGHRRYDDIRAFNGFPGIGTVAGGQAQCFRILTQRLAVRLAPPIGMDFLQRKKVCQQPEMAPGLHTAADERHTPCVFAGEPGRHHGAGTCGADCGHPVTVDHRQGNAGFAVEEHDQPVDLGQAPGRIAGVEDH